MANEQPDLTSLTTLLTTALQQAMANATAAARDNVVSQNLTSKPPAFAVREFKEGSTSVQDYFKHFDAALKLSKIGDEDHKQYALVYMGSELSNALKLLASPKTPEELTYSEIKASLIMHFDGVKNIYAESIKFRQIIQEENESIGNFILRLKQAVAFCDYKEFLDRMLIEQLLLGLRSREFCNEIISKKPNTFAAACDMAFTLESAIKTAVEMQSSHPQNTVEPINKLGYPPVKNKPSSGSRKHMATTGMKCNGCGGQHNRNQCRFREATCYLCKKKGHIARVCKSKTSQISEPEFLEPCDELESTTEYAINEIGEETSTARSTVVAKIDGNNLEMELDTGAPCAIVSMNTLRQIKPHFSLQKTNRKFTSYTKNKIECLGRLPVNVTIGKSKRRLNLYVTSGNFDTLMGREWISHFASEIDFATLFSGETTSDDQINHILTTPHKLTVEKQKRINELLDQFKDLFSDTPGKLNGPPATLQLKPGATPVFARARDIPVALKDMYAAEIDRKLEAGFFERVDHSEWASTTHIVAKKNGKIRITGNYKPTLNPRMVIDEHPIPKAEHLFNKLKGATIFCHLDITDAYMHLPIDEKFSHALTLNTPTHGLIRPTRAVYGAANVPAIWQRRMDSIFRGMPNVLNFFDDILVFSDDFESLLSSLQTILQKIRDNGLRLNRSKCIFAASSVEFLGHKIDASGIKKSDYHVRNIRDSPIPENFEELQLFVGKATYYNAFIPNLSTIDRPLRDMLRKDHFKWTQEGKRAYTEIKRLLISPQVLMPYDPSLPLWLATDASKTGLGAVLSHRLPDGSERPIAYASRTLSVTEQKYPQIDKEALAIVWAVQKFFLYLYARKWTLITDHKPLSQILHPEKSLPVLCISRMANYADFLANFNFDVVYKSSRDNINADFCSRIHPRTQPNNNNNNKTIDDFDAFMINHVDQLSPLDARKVALETRKDKHLSRIVELLEKGYDLVRMGYKSPEANYSLAAGCLIFQHRVVIPESLRKFVLEDLHTAHLGIVKMKGLARSFIFWPKIDAEIEREAKCCSKCAEVASMPKKFSEHHWEYPKAPWERVHLDYAGPLFGYMLLIVSDAYSKWLEVKITRTSTSIATIHILDELFASYGVPITVVTDNGPCFKSEEFERFLKKSGVKFHKCIAPYHPATNGQAERCVQSVKRALKSMDTTQETLQENINEFLRQYRKAPHSTTSESPAKLFLNRSIRTKFDLIKPDNLQTRMGEKQRANFSSTYRVLPMNQEVFFLSGNPRMERWIKGTITKRTGDLHYEIVFRGKTYKRHIDQIRQFGWCNEQEAALRSSEKSFHESFNRDSEGKNQFQLCLSNVCKTLPTESTTDQYRNPEATTASPSSEHSSLQSSPSTTPHSPRPRMEQAFESPRASPANTSSSYHQRSHQKLPPIAQALTENHASVPQAACPSEALRRSQRTRKPRTLYSP